MTSVEKIDSIIKDRHISRRKLAIMAKIPPSTLQSAMTRGEIHNVVFLSKIASALGISAEDLYGDEVLAHPSLNKFAESFADKLDPDTMRVDENGVVGFVKKQEDPKRAEDTLIGHFQKLNPKGQLVALDRMEELAEHPRYRKAPPQDEAQDGEKEG